MKIAVIPKKVEEIRKSVLKIYGDCVVACVYFCEMCRGVDDYLCLWKQNGRSAVYELDLNKLGDC